MYLKIKEIMSRLSICETTARRLTNAIPDCKIRVGKSVRYDWQAIEEYLATNRIIELHEKAEGEE